MEAIIRKKNTYCYTFCLTVNLERTFPFSKRNVMKVDSRWSSFSLLKSESLYIWRFTVLNDALYYLEDAASLSIHYRHSKIHTLKKWAIYFKSRLLSNAIQKFLSLLHKEVESPSFYLSCPYILTGREGGTISLRKI